MKAKYMVCLAIGLLGATLAAGCTAAAPPGAQSVGDLLADPVYDTEVSIYGEISALGELLCPCFMLTSGGETVDVWYDLMVEENETQRPAVSVAGIENGDRVVVTGELRSSEGLLPSRTFWASSIEKTE